MMGACQFYGLSVTLVKISVLLFYRRVFDIARLRRQIYAIGFLVIAWLVVHNLICVFKCNPIQKFWDHDLPGHCLDTMSAIRGEQVFNIILDVVILALPVKAIMKLQLPMDRKLSAIALFLLGGL